MLQIKDIGNIKNIFLSLYWFQRSCLLCQQTPGFLAPATVFVDANVSKDQGSLVVSR